MHSEYNKKNPSEIFETSSSHLRIILSATAKTRVRRPPESAVYWLGLGAMGRKEMKTFFLLFYSSHGYTGIGTLRVLYFAGKARISGNSLFWLLPLQPLSLFCYSPHFCLPLSPSPQFPITQFLHRIYRWVGRGRGGCIEI